MEHALVYLWQECLATCGFRTNHRSMNRRGSQNCNATRPRFAVGTITAGTATTNVATAVSRSRTRAVGSAACGVAHAGGDGRLRSSCRHCKTAVHRIFVVGPSPRNLARRHDSHADAAVCVCLQRLQEHRCCRADIFPGLYFKHPHISVWGRLWCWRCRRCWQRGCWGR